MVLLGEQAVPVWMNFIITTITIENVLVLACEPEVAQVACEGTNVVLVDAILLGHNIKTNSNSLSYHIWVVGALVTFMHLPLLLLLRIGLLLGHRLRVGPISLSFEPYIIFILITENLLEILDIKSIHSVHIIGHLVDG